MSSDGSEKLAWRTALGCGLVAVACMLLPVPIQSAIRATANDALRPGQTMVRPLFAAGSADSEPRVGGSVDSPELVRRVRELELQLRQERLREARLQEELKLVQSTGVAPFIASPSSRLMVWEMLSARVLGRERDLSGTPALLLDLGASNGATEEAFVVYGADPVLDQGTDSGIQPGQPVYAGRCVLGRITRAGRRTCAVRLTTDPKYSARAQLLRETASGAQFGAEAILKGRGNGTCELTGVPYTEPVSVGDAVYTGGRSALFPTPMYYGRVIEAKLEAGQRWSIVVKPNFDVDEIREVAVLRENMSSSRVLGQ